MKNKDILFIGDSLIEYGDWDRLLGVEILNRGMGGDTTQGVLMRLKRSLQCQPHKLFMMIGVNDLITGVPMEHILHNYNTILETITRESLQTQVYIHKALPSNPEKLFFVFKNRQVMILNRQIEGLSQEHNAVCLDLWPILTQNNILQPEYTVDGVHLTEGAYKLWAALLKAYV